MDSLESYKALYYASGFPVSPAMQTSQGNARTVASQNAQETRQLAQHGHHASDGLLPLRSSSFDDERPGLSQRRSASDDRLTQSARSPRTVSPALSADRDEAKRQLLSPAMLETRPKRLSSMQSSAQSPTVAGKAPAQTTARTKATLGLGITLHSDSPARKTQTSATRARAQVAIQVQASTPPTGPSLSRSVATPGTPSPLQTSTSRLKSPLQRSSNLPRPVSPVKPRPLSASLGSGKRTSGAQTSARDAPFSPRFGSPRSPLVSSVNSPRSVQRAAESRIPIAAVSMQRALSGVSHDYSKSPKQFVHPLSSFAGDEREATSLYDQAEDSDAVSAGASPPSLGSTATSSSATSLENGTRDLEETPKRQAKRRNSYRDRMSPSSRAAGLTVDARERPESSASHRPGSATSRGSTDKVAFFGSTGLSAQDRHVARIQSASSASGKVISTLQTELLSTKTSLEAVRAQLRLSHRTTEYLGREADDLKGQKERLELEIENLSKMLQRRERQLDETLIRARTAESHLSDLDQRQKVADQDAMARVKELELALAESTARTHKAESEYNALRKGVSSMRSELQREQASSRKLLDEALVKHTSQLQLAQERFTLLERALQNRTALQSSLIVTQSRLSKETAEFSAEVSKELAELKQRSADDGSRVTTALTEVDTVAEQTKRLVRLARASSSGSPST
ncbi:uncharacterized protein L969DRAFT_395736 [Mixia osmundae IAM 14324]|uniref:SWI5-dependent HO expression protein 3 n=1 Tax=Mixia osmundae (strain CBS 9802 / IAM 14324 / JCM 22182 / KY 12970) TaxID=764103 RepID=G7E9P8_MIXOS|nr:uncharacterized protein L969DRAFT_395736 [Mixia osmundae IAM 14324]KEI39998.1 hypothetical protein L969DRAFT_395736 [Mixia osmundae IAM 14324]GAA99367.1 hypothetical protein E5Q_06063 [Mixia osmundae IAM 14324]